MVTPSVLVPGDASSSLVESTTRVHKHPPNKRGCLFMLQYLFMSDFRSVYKGSEHYTKIGGFGLFFLLAFLIFLQVFFSPFAVLAGVVTVLCVVMTMSRPLLTILLLAAYLPFESFIF